MSLLILQYAGITLHSGGRYGYHFVLVDDIEDSNSHTLETNLKNQALVHEEAHGLLEME